MLEMLLVFGLLLTLILNYEHAYKRNISMICIGVLVVNSAIWSVIGDSAIEIDIGYWSISAVESWAAVFVMLCGWTRYVKVVSSYLVISVLLSLGYLVNDGWDYLWFAEGIAAIQILHMLWLSDGMADLIVKVGSFVGVSRADLHNNYSSEEWSE